MNQVDETTPELGETVEASSGVGRTVEERRFKRRVNGRKTNRPSGPAA